MSHIQFGDPVPVALPAERPLTTGSWRAKARQVNRTGHGGGTRCAVGRGYDDQGD